MSTTNGAKTFLYVVRHIQGTSDCTYLCRCDHDPDASEIAEALHLNYDEMHDTLEAVRFSEDNLPTIPPKK